MTGTFMQTLPNPAPLLVVFRRRRREVILNEDGRPRILSETLTVVEANVSPKIARAARRAGGWIRHRVALAHLGAVAVGVAVRVISEDVAGWVAG